MRNESLDIDFDLPVYGLKAKLKRLSPQAKVQLVLWTIPVLVLAAYLLRQYVFVPDKTQIERLIEKGEQAVEAESIPDCVRILGEDFVMIPGDFGRNDLKEYWLSDQFATFDQFSLKVSNMQVSVFDQNSERTAESTFDVSGTLVWNGQMVAISYSRGEPFHFKILWAKRNGKWKATYLELPFNVSDVKELSID